VRDAATIDNAISFSEMITETYPLSHKSFSDLGDAYVKKDISKKQAIKKALLFNPTAKDIKTNLRD
jgi:hypothetical protein